MRGPGIFVYAADAGHASVCYLRGTSEDLLLAAANARHPGTWRFAVDPVFASGGPNPRPCNEHPAREHRLLVR